jgi:hypothetical protein
MGDMGVIKKYENKMMDKGLKEVVHEIWKVEGALKSSKGIIKKS